MSRDSIDIAFLALSRRMTGHPATPMTPRSAPESLVSLIDKVNAAKRAYEPRVR